MTKSKDKRIKKLKRKRIWPSVLGLFIITMFFSLCLLMIVTTGVASVVTNRINNGHQVALQVAKRYVEPNVTQLDQAYPGIIADIDMIEDIDAVSIMLNGTDRIWSSNDKYPNQDMRVSYSALFSKETNFTDYDIVLEDQGQQLVVNEDGVYELKQDFIRNVNWGNLFIPQAIDGKTSYLPFVSMKIWYCIPVDDYEVYVLNDISLYIYDVWQLLITGIMCALLLAVFVIYYICTFVGVITSQNKVTKVLYTDMVTGGDNWLSFIRKSEKLIKRNRKGIRKYAIVHLRMEKYRSFCTCFGVKEGEELLERFYRALRKQMHTKETMAHYEQADFALLLKYEDELEITKRIEELEQALGDITPNIKLYFSVGICLVEKKSKDIEEIYNNAMSATAMLEENEESGIAFFDIEMKKQQLWEHKVEDEMERALKSKEFKVYLQPKYSAKEERIAGAEALVRWMHPEDGLIPPNRFIPIFERNGFILQLDDYMLEEVAEQQAKWMQAGQELFPISVNVSRAHFTRENLAEHICGIIDKYQVPHHVIELELTESAFFDDKEVLLNTVKQLREFGFVVSMDDFGAGYSSLNSLKELHIDVLKIDADFFRGADSEERGLLIVSEVIDLAKKLDMKIVAEGIENREQVDFLAKQECDLIQGYYFAKPMPINEFEERYKEEAS